MAHVQYHGNMAASSGVGVKEGAKSWSKWEIALLVGTPVALGVGYLLYRTHYKSSRDRREDRTKRTKESSRSKHENKSAGSQGATAQLDDYSLPLEDPFTKAQAAKNKGNELYVAAKYDEAISYYNEAIRLCPSEKGMELAKFYQNRAAAQEGLKNYTAVKADCTKALEYNSKYTKALFRRAKACEVLKDLQQCLEDVTAVCILEGFQKQATLLMADRILKELGKQHAKEAINQRQPLMPSKHFIKTYFSSFAEDPFTEAMENETLQQENKKTGYLLALEYLKDGKYDQVINVLTEGLEQEPDGPYRGEAFLLRGSFNLLTGEMNKALDDLTNCISLSNVPLKVKVNALIKRASAYLQQEKVGECLQDFETASDLDPQNSDIYHHRGQMYLLTDKTAEAMSDFDKAVNLNSEFPIAYVQKCYTEYRHAVAAGDNHKVEEVLKSFVQAIEKFPKCTECYSLYGQVLSDRQEYEKADSYFLKALEVDPDNATVFVHRGLLQLQSSGDVSEAIKLISKAVEMDDKCEFGYETLGTIEVQRGNMKRAIELFDKAIPLAKTELEMAHLFSLKDAATAQSSVASSLGIQIPTFGM